jgi:uncharacterized membrane protein
MNVCVRILVVATALAASPARAGTYKFTTVDGPSPNAGGTQLAGINNYGAVAGVTHDALFNEQGFFGSPAGKFTVLGLPFGQVGFWPSQAVITGINDYDEVLGYVPVNRRTHFQGFMFELYDGELLPIGVPTRLLGAPARSMNDDDTIAGSLSTGLGKTSGYILDVWNHLTTFDATPWTSWTAAVGINNNGTVVGQYVAGLSTGMTTAGFLRDPYGKITLLPTPKWIGGVAVGNGGIYYNAINDGGVTVGSFLDPSNHSHGFVRDAAGNFTLIQFPGASATAGVVGINNSGTIVGNYLDASGVEHGFIGTPAAGN